MISLNRIRQALIVSMIITSGLLFLSKQQSKNNLQLPYTTSDSIINKLKDFGNVNLINVNFSEKEKIKNGSSINRSYLIGGDLVVDEDTYHALLNFSKENSDKRDTLPTRKFLTVMTDESEIKLLNSWPSNTIRFGIYLKTFRANRRKQIVEYLVQASNDWMNVCGIKFIYDPSYDSSTEIDEVPSNFDFMVRRKSHDSNNVLASAFLGNANFSLRFLNIDPFYFDQKVYNRLGVIRHELGHIMGFLHEHILPNQPLDCYGLGKDTRLQKYFFREYDPNSCMHYLCLDSEGNQVGSKDLTITDTDQRISQIFYGPPSL